MPRARPPQCLIMRSGQAGPRRLVRVSTRRRYRNSPRFHHHASCVRQSSREHAVSGSLILSRRRYMASHAGCDSACTKSSSPLNRRGELHSLRASTTSDLKHLRKVEEVLSVVLIGDKAEKGQFSNRVLTDDRTIRIPSDYAYGWQGGGETGGWDLYYSRPKLGSYTTQHLSANLN
jgi:hypothetical protein